jgi:hypothetical protein
LEPPKPKIRTPQPVAREQEEWTPDYVEEEIRPQREVMQARSYESIQYEEEEDNWSETTDKDAYQKPAGPKPTTQPYNKTYAQQYEDDEDLEGDAWLDVPKPVNIPKKVKERQVEYEEES